MQVQPKKKKTRFIWAGLLLAFLLFTLAPRCSTLIDLYGQVWVLKAEKEQLLVDQERLNLERERMEQIETVERLARERLGLVRPGERMILELNQ